MGGFASPAFQLYRLRDSRSVWWRMVSPNGRVLAVSASAFATPEQARGHIDMVISARDRLQPSVRVTETHRWQWALAFDSVREVRGHAEQDRRVRCEAAWRSFVQMAPRAVIDESVHIFTGGALATSRISPSGPGVGTTTNPS